MKIHLRADNASPSHVTFTVFVNGGNSGQLRMTLDEGTSFHQIVAHGCVKGIDSFLSSGKWAEDPDD